jgi:alpha-galactosidase
MEPVTLGVNMIEVPFADGVVKVGGLDLVVQTSDAAPGRRIDISVRNGGRDTVTVDRVTVGLQARPEWVLEHGHQSWSVVRRARPTDVRPERAGIPDWARGCHVSDPDGAGQVIAGDQFLVTTDGVAGFLDGKQHMSTVVARPGALVLTALLDGVEIRPGDERLLDPCWVAAGPPGPLYSAYADAWGAEAGARVDAAAPVGWCSWYHYFAEIEPGEIRSNLLLAAEHGLAFVQIDDGYQAAIGDWTDYRAGWQDGTEALAKEIASAGLDAGIWTAPFIAGANSRLFKAHPDWVPAHSSGHPLKATFNDGSWGGWALALDTTRPDVLDHLRATYRALRDQGFRYHKIDFCYAAALTATRDEPTMTRGQALRAGLEAVRDGIGDDAFLLGCGCPFGQAVGIVDAMRVSADVAPHWEPRGSWPGFEETAPAAVNAIAASVLRAPLHRRVFINDPDCLLLRPEETELTAEQRSFLVAVIAGVGGFAVLSDDLALYTEAEWSLLEAARVVLSDVDTPLDIDDPFATPLVVRSRVGTALTVDWRTDPPAAPRAELGMGQ